MNHSVTINLLIQNSEVPDLRQSVGWDRRDHEYPVLFKRCNFWAGVRDSGKLIAFGYIAGMGLQHGYMEDVMVHPGYQRQGIGEQLVKKLLEEAALAELEIVTVTYDDKHSAFYKKCGFSLSSSGVWRTAT